MDCLPLPNVISLELGHMAAKDRCLHVLKKKYINDHYLPSAVFIAQMLVGPRKQLKQIIQIEYKHCSESQLAGGKPVGYLQAWPRIFELGATEKQIQVVARAGLEPATAGLRVRHSDHSATLPPSSIWMFFTPEITPCQMSTAET